MNNQIKKILPLAVIVAIAAIIIGNMGDTSFLKQMSGSVSHVADTTSQAKSALKHGAFGEEVSDDFSEDMAFKSSKNASEDSPEFVRKPKPLVTGFSGYKIEIKTVYNKPLALTDDIFQSFGGVKIDRRTDDSYTYLVGDFTDKEACDDYFTKVIESRFPNATKVKYQNGELVKYK